MADLLLFTFAAPLASFGTIAPGERRGTAARPGHAGLVGLIAAALGLLRDDARQRPLAQDLAFAVRIDRTGGLLTDYHTAQTAAARKGRRFATRRDVLEVADLGTILSQREYRTDCAFTVATLTRAGKPFSLAAIGDALERPHFMLTAGRRACPLALPLAPRLLQAGTLPEALATYDAAENSEGGGARAGLRESLGLLADAPRVGFDIAFDPLFSECGLLDAAASRTEVRRDDPIDRDRWQFGQRAEGVLRVAAASHTGASP